MDTNKKSLTEKQRKEKLKKLIEELVIIPYGDQLVIAQEGPEGQDNIVPVANFVKKNDENDDNVYLATVTGIIVFEANDLHEFAHNKAKSLFLENLDIMLEQKENVLKIQKKVKH